MKYFRYILTSMPLLRRRTILTKSAFTRKALLLSLPVEARANNSQSVLVNTKYVLINEKELFWLKMLVFKVIF